MKDFQVDPGRKARWWSGIAISMLLSAFVGLLPLFNWFNDHQDGNTRRRLGDAVELAAMAVCMSFWVLLPIVYFSYIRKSASALEYERLVHQGELARARRRNAEIPNPKSQ